MSNKDIFLPGTEITNCADFIKYWDKWHKEWYLKSSNWIANGVIPRAGDNILGWPIPPDPIWRDFPEPYWGNPSNPKAVFIHINPAGGGGDLRLPAAFGNTLYGKYSANDGVYSKTITALGGQALPAPIYGSAVNWHNKRAVWASNICNVLPAWNVNEILDLDLVPWHTKGIGGINLYLGMSGVSNLIMNKIFIPAIHICNTITTCFHNNIIGRGKPVMDKIIDPAFAAIFAQPYRAYTSNMNPRNEWFINDLKFSTLKAKCKVYKGGYGGMNFPNNGDTFIPLAPVPAILPIPYTSREIITNPGI